MSSTSRHPASYAQDLALPNMRKQPSFTDVLHALERLELQPSSWSTMNEDQAVMNEAKEVNNFLMSVISSDLDWFKPGEGEGATASAKQDTVRDLAGKRVAERCGRSAMPEFVRAWTIPKSATHPEFEIKLREPSIVNDGTGLKTWGTAFVMAKKMEEIGTKCFGGLISTSTNADINIPDTFTTAGGKSFVRPDLRVLELGSGTGLVGLASAAVFSCSVVLTDLPDILANLAFNVNHNAQVIKTHGGSATAVVLDWRDSEGALVKYGGDHFEIVIATDPIYDDHHPALVAKAIKQHLKKNRHSRALVAVPLRDKATSALVTKFITEMRGHGLQLTHQGTELCVDDFVRSGENLKCHWTVWEWYIPYEFPLSFKST